MTMGLSCVQSDKDCIRCIKPWQSSRGINNSISMTIKHSKGRPTLVPVCQTKPEKQHIKTSTSVYNYRKQRVFNRSSQQCVQSLGDLLKIYVLLQKGFLDRLVM